MLPSQHLNGEPTSESQHCSRFLQEILSEQSRGKMFFLCTFPLFNASLTFTCDFHSSYVFFIIFNFFSIQFLYGSTVLVFLKKKTLQAHQWAFNSPPHCQFFLPLLTITTSESLALPYSTCRLAEVHELVVWSVQIFGVLGCVCFTVA